MLKVVERDPVGGFREAKIKLIFAINPGTDPLTTATTKGVKEPLTASSSYSLHGIDGRN